MQSAEPSTTSSERSVQTDATAYTRTAEVNSRKTATEWRDTKRNRNFIIAIDCEKKSIAFSLLERRWGGFQQKMPHDELMINGMLINDPALSSATLGDVDFRQ
jgi:hypothetical protein